MYCGKCGRAIPSSGSRCLQCGEGLPPALKKYAQKQAAEQTQVKYFSAAQALDDCARQEGASLILFKFYRIYFLVVLMGMFLPTNTDTAYNPLLGISPDKLQILFIISVISIAGAVVTCIMLWRAAENSFLPLALYTLCMLLMLLFAPKMPADVLVASVLFMAFDAYMCYYLYTRRPVFKRFREIWRKKR